MDAEQRALVEDAHELHELTKHPGWKVLERRALEWMRADKAKVLDGIVVDLAEYKRMTGKFVGAEFVLRLPEMIGESALKARQREAERSGGEAA